MGRKRYSGYRGRTSAEEWLRRIALVLFLLVLLAGGALIAGQKYIVYTDSGLRMDLPFLKQDKSEEELGEITVVVEPEEPEQEQPFEPPVEQHEVPLRAVELDVETLLAGTALDQVKAAGANAVVLNMKDDRGNLGYVSSQAAAVQAGANFRVQEINQAIQSLAQEELLLIARVSCFRDHRLSDSLTYAIETNPGRRWQDLDGVRWSNPAKPAVREYLVGVAQELAALGFDEILLDNWGYPTREDGRLEYIKKGQFYDSAQLETAIAEFLGQMGQALEGSDAKLSLYCKDSVLQSLPNQSGQTLKQVGGISGRVWTEKPENAAVLLTQAGLEQPLVELVPSFTEETTAHQAVLNTEE